MDTIKDIVQHKYGQAALRARAGHKADCGCGTSCCSTITSDLYDESQGDGNPRGSHARVARVRQSDRARGIEAG